MDAESFFQRWSRRKAEAVEQEPAAERPASQTPAAEPDKPDRPPTITDVAALTPDSDFKPFLARGVDESVRRSALKKLFADPHFNVMDGLDVYIDDYTKFEPIPPEMLAALNHAKSLFSPAPHIEKTVMEMLDAPREPADPAAEDPAALPAEQPASDQAVTSQNTQEMSARGKEASGGAHARDDTGADPVNLPEEASHDDPV